MDSGTQMNLEDPILSAANLRHAATHRMILFMVYETEEQENAETD